MAAESELEEKQVVVVGGSTGIGRACAREFHRSGAKVSVIALPSVELNALEDAGLTAFAGDLTDCAFLQEVAESVGNVDIFVYCAGIAPHAPFLEGDPDIWDRTLDINLRAFLRLSQPIARRMAKSRSGHFILVSSALANAVYSNTMVYAASKHALSAIHKGLRVELSQYGIRSTEIRPGLVGGTGIFANSGLDATEAAALVAAGPYRPIEPEDLARAIVFAAKTPSHVDIDVIEVKPVGQA